jgi:hypothetical protein
MQYIRYFQALRAAVVFDFDLHFRFLRKATEALFETSQASVAATLAWQSHIHDGLTRGNQPTGIGVSFWPIQFENSASAAPNRTASDEPWFAAVRAWQTIAECGALAVSGAGLSIWSAIPTQPITSVSPWTMYQAPMIATMLAYGVPYAVAAPAARGSTSAMEAADAAYTQWQCVFGASPKAASRQPVTAPWLAHWL